MIKTILLMTFLLSAQMASAFDRLPDAHKQIVKLLLADDAAIWLRGGDSLIDWGIRYPYLSKKIEATEIVGVYMTNELLARRSFEDKWIRVVGDVRSVRISSDGQPYANLLVMNHMVGFKAFLPASQQTESLKSGSTIDIVCSDISKVYSSVVADCEYTLSMMGMKIRQDINDVMNDMSSNMNGRMRLVFDANPDNEETRRTCVSGSNDECMGLVKRNIERFSKVTLAGLIKEKCPLGSSDTSDACVRYKGLLSNRYGNDVLFKE